MITNTMRGKNYEKAIENAERRILESVAIVIEGDAILHVPVDTGRLKGSIGHATKNKQSNRSRDAVSVPREDMVAHVGTNVEYAPYVEYGTRHTRKKPFLRPALKKGKAAAKKIMQTEIRKALKDGK